MGEEVDFKGGDDVDLTLTSLLRYICNVSTVLHGSDECRWWWGM